MFSRLLIPTGEKSGGRGNRPASERMAIGNNRMKSDGKERRIDVI